MDILKINKEFLESLLSQAKDNPRLRQNYVFVPVKRIRVRECSMP